MAFPRLQPSGHSRALDRERAVGQACAQLAAATTDAEIYRITASAIVRIVDVPCSVIIALDQIDAGQRSSLTDATNLARKEVFFVTAGDLHGQVADAYAARQVCESFSAGSLRWLARQVAREGRVRASRLVPLMDEVAAHGALIVVAEESLSQDIVSALSTLSSTCCIALSRKVLEAAVVERTDKLTAANVALTATQEDLATRERNARILFESNPHPMWVFDDNTLKFVAVNNAAVREYGYTREEFLAMRITDVGWPHDSLHFGARRKQGQGLQMTRETVHVLADGRQIDVEVIVQPLDFVDRNVSLVLAQNVTQRKALERELRHQALHDPLTGLANRALLTDRLNHFLSRRGANSCGVLVLDLDDFKNVNDSLGHSAGDMLLVELSQRITEVLRTCDTAARLGGDEFAILVEDIASVDDAMEVARRILATLQSPFEFGDKKINIAASIGVTASDEAASTSFEELLRNADVAMYAAKAQGKGRCRLYTSDMYDRVVQNINAEAELRQAVTKGELFLEYQPIATCGGDVVGVEALVRWRHPDRGVIAPDKFIALAETTGLIVPLTRWVLLEACSTVLPFEATTGRPLVVSVNISGFSLDRADLVADVREALEESRLEPWRLTLEVTETAVAADMESAKRRLGDLKALGVYLAIDDFGTGHSSLAQLEGFPVDVVKIDQSFIARLGETKAATAVVRAVIELARAMKLRVICEGVETAEQAALLVSLAPQAYVQGYFYARPLSLEALDALLREVRQRNDSVGERGGAAPVTRLMIVDDNEDLRVVLERVFQDLSDFEVVATACNGQEAVTLAQEHRPDVVLMDAQMPVKDGIAAARLIRASLPATKVVMMSGTDGLLLASHARSVGDAFIAKGTKVSELVGVITRVMDPQPHPLAGQQPLHRSLPTRKGDSLRQAPRPAPAGRLSAERR
jgi:diguanylate cyclase (GGDEF)-like protein/PAS domain S-box-containing protein